MTPLRQRMLDELCRHNYAPRTQESYVLQIAKLARHYGISPDLLTREQVQAYQDLLTSQRVSWLPQAVAAMQFFYNKTLERDWEFTHDHQPRTKRSPVVLTPEEIARLLSAAEPLKAKIIFTTMYACGLRVSGALKLRVGDLDSGRMVIHIRQAKGRKDRYVPLGTTLLEQLRDYWRAERPSSFLFPGSQANKPWNVTSVRQEFQLARRIAGIETPCTTHALRHSYASHCLQAGMPVGMIQQVLGHASLETTATYTHVNLNTSGTHATSGTTDAGYKFPDLLDKDL